MQVITFFVSLILLTCQPLSAKAPENSPRALVHLLDFLAQDYAGAVSGGKIISRTEYKEQLEFSEMAVEINAHLSTKENTAGLQRDLEKLHQMVVNKAGENDVANEARKIKMQVVVRTGLEMAPVYWPSIKSGQELFQKNCVTCHGVNGNGDGPAGASLNPKPANFLEAKRMDELTPFQAFNAIRIGVPGTAMAPFYNLNDQDTWALAFYVNSLIHVPAVPNDSSPGKKDNQALFRRACELVPLEKTSTLSDNEIKKILPGSEEEKKIVLAVLRTHEGDDDLPSSLRLAHSYLNQALIEYKEEHFEIAKNKSLTAYLEGIEPVEPRLKATDPTLTTDLEQRMANVRTAIEAHLPVASVEDSIREAKEGIHLAEGLLTRTPPSAWVTFMVASAILLREGFEAVLIILALLGVIRATGDKRAARWVHGGWVLALLSGVAAWFFSGWLLNLGGASRELMEGFTSLFAVAVLLYMGFWLHKKTEITRWNSFINGQVKEALKKGKQSGRLWGLATLSFMAVFREAFETVLFLRALWLEGGSDTKMALLSGVIGALILIFILSTLLLKYTAALPIRRVFDYSSILMAVLAVILIGKGFHSLQETGLMGITASPLNFRFDFVGFYPTLQTTASQLCVFLLCMALWIVGKKPSPAKNKAPSMS